MNIPENFDRWMFDYMEGNLSSSEAEVFEQFLLQNPEFEPDADAWQNAVVEDMPVVYPNMQSLEQKERAIGWYGWSAAALVLLLIGVGGSILVGNNPQNGAFNLRSSHFTANQPTTLHNRFLTANQENDGIASINSTDITAQSVTNNAETQYNNVANQQGTANHQNTINQTTNSERYTPDTDLAEVDNEGMGQNLEEENLSTQNDELTTINLSLMQAQEKFHSDKHAGQYQHNPSEMNVDLDLSKKSHVNLTSLSSRTKGLVRKIEKMLDYPVGLINLRDQDLLIPENSLVSLNPGFAGGMLKPRFEMKYQGQWFGTEHETHRSQFIFDNYVKDVKGGFAISLNSETYSNGAFGDYSIDFAYSPKISLNKNAVLEPGVKFTMGALVANAANFDGKETFEMNRGQVLNTHMFDADKTERLWYKDFGVGAVLNTKWFYAGFAADNLARHYANVFRSEADVEPVRTPVLYNAVIGADYKSQSKIMTLSPFIAARKFGDNSEVWAGLNYCLDYLTIGGSISTNKDFTGSIGLKFKKFKMIYQYDRTRSMVNQEQMGSHNIGIRFNGR